MNVVLDRWTSYVLVHMKSHLTNIHVIRLPKIADWSVDNVDFAQFATFDTVRFHQLTTIFEYFLGDRFNRLSLKRREQIAMREALE